MDGPRRILYVQRPNGGGSATGLYDLLKSLDRERYTPAVLFYESNRYCELFRELDVEVDVLGGRSTARPLPSSVKRPLGALGSLDLVRAGSRLIRRDWPLARRIARRIRDARADLVHHNDNPRADRASFLAARLAGVPQISHVRYMPEYVRPVDRPLASLVDEFIYMSRAIREHHRSRVGVPEELGRVIYDPIELEEYEVPAGAGPGVRKELGLTERDRVVTNVGRLVRWKGQDVFLDAFARIAEGHPDAIALLVGSSGGKEREEEYARGLRRRMEALGLSDRVVFTGFRSDVPAILAASEVVVHSATEPEPFGRVVVEAMAAGRPIVAMDAGGVPEIVEHENTGLLVPPSRPGALARAIDVTLNHPDRATEMAERARLAARARFAPERFARELHDVYERVLSSGNGRGRPGS